MNKLFVASLPWSVCKVALKNHFSKFGPVTDGIVLLDRATNRSKGFGFVTFANNESLQRALQAQHEIEGRKLVVNIAYDKPRENNYDNNRNNRNNNHEDDLN
ncbi:hypothetical protein SAMD00019534_103600 [Acytostelium subglobosum LB1]|uniref:hypothetical protein n=1 Tax=Acytostelium subglobosum LB1 TaxID=1410327 RepID=UPI0006450FB2|nr:hypothetical protein SAMD00019534_103600 [Acytostelium subglobosum LB1]GAM27185.1 hypothetical protein SAMD00019534_103600 [Acytostelium subglobosum LB1]|eukprot:XP_012750065.1 hypothetical protein SAMD00019534_103600 [Acytostelium subglobosum LB1]